MSPNPPSDPAKRPATTEEALAHPWLAEEPAGGSAGQPATGTAPEPATGSGSALG
jgi:hypothetical protein